VLEKKRRLLPHSPVAVRVFNNTMLVVSVGRVGGAESLGATGRKRTLGRASALALTEPHPPFEANARPALQRFIIQRLTLMTRGHDQHSGGDQLITGMGGWPGVPGAIPGVRNVGESATGRLLCQ
jgi:hypothetical protein